MEDEKIKIKMLEGEKDSNINLERWEKNLIKTLEGWKNYNQNFGRWKKVQL